MCTFSVIPTNFSENDAVDTPFDWSVTHAIVQFPCGDVYFSATTSM